MVTPEEFRKAVETIHTALRDRIVTYGLTSTYNYMHHVTDEIVITGRHPKARATYYYDDVDGYKQAMGTQDNFEVAVMTANDRIELDAKAARDHYEKALKSSIEQEKALAAKARELAQSQAKLREMELELARLKAGS